MSRQNVRTEAAPASLDTGSDARADHRVDVIDDWESFCALRPDWDVVHNNDPESHFFLSWGWLAEFFRDNLSRWRVFAVRATGPGTGYIGFFPAKYRVHWSTSTKSFQTEIEAGGRLGWSEYAGFLCNPAHEKQVLTALADKLAAMPWVRLSVCYEPSLRRADIFMNAFPQDRFRSRHKNYRINRGQTDNLICPQIALPADYETYLQTCLSSNTRQKIRRFTRKFVDTGELRITQTTPDTFERDTEILLDQWQQKWSPLKGADKAQDIANMYRRMLKAGLKLDALHLPILWRGDAPLGALGSIADVNTKHLCFILAGRNEAENTANTGLLLHSQSIRWAIENGIETYDFGHGDEAYKYSFGARDRRVKYFSIRRRNAAESELLDPINIREVMKKASQSTGSQAADKMASANRQMLYLLERNRRSAPDGLVHRDLQAS